MEIKPEYSSNPWLGLQTYTEAHRLYGRNKDIEALTGIIEHNTASVLFGRSGIGKSSLIHAGIFPALRKLGVQPIYIRFEHNTEESYVQQIIEAVSAQFDLRDHLDSRTPIDGLWDFFYRNDFINQNGTPVRPIIIIDQFEEIYTLTDNNHKLYAQQLYDELADLFNNVRPDRLIEREISNASYKQSELHVNNSTLTLQIPTLNKQRYKTSTDFRFVISLREDYLYYLERNTSMIPSLKLNRYALRALDVDGAKDVICLPQPGLYTEDQAISVIDKLAVLDENDVKQIDPTILSVYLYKSFISKGNTKTDDIISEFYRDETKVISEASLAFLEDHLITGHGFRQAIPYADAVENGVSAEDLSQLFRSRILTLESRRGHDYIEYSHDVLCPIAKQGRDDRFLRLQKKKLRKRIAIATIAFGILVAFGGIVSFLAFKVSEKEKEVTILNIHNKSVQSSLLAQDGDALGAVRLLLQILPSDEMDVPLRPETESALYEVYDSIQSQYACIAHLKHFNDVNSAMYNHDGTRIITACEDGNCYLWSSRSGVQLGNLIGHSSSVNYAEYSNDGKYLVSASSDKTAIIWDATKMEVIHKLKGHAKSVLFATFSPDGKIVATSSADGTVRLWDVKTGKQKNVIAKSSTYISSCRFSIDGKKLVTSSLDGDVVKVMNLNGDVLLSIKDVPNTIDYACFSNSGKYILTVASSCVKVWSVLTGKSVASFCAPKELSIKCANFDQDDNQIAYSFNNGKVGVWEWESNLYKEPFKGHGITTKWIAFSPDGMHLLSSARDNLVKIWNLTTTQEVLDINGGFIPFTTFSGSKDMIASCSSEDKLYIWQLKNGKYELCSAFNLPCYALSVTFSGDNKNVIATLSDGTIGMYNIQNEHTVQLSIPLNETFDYAFLMPDRQNVMAISPWDIPVLWNFESNIVMPDYFKDKKKINDISISSDNKWWLIAHVGEKNATLQSYTNPNEKYILEGHSAEVECVSFSPNGKYAATGGNDNDVIIWDIETKSMVSVLKGHSSQVYFVQFSPDGEYVYSASTDKTARIWNVETKQYIRLFNINNENDPQMQYAFSHNGKLLLMVQDGNMKLINNPNTKELINYLRNIIKQ